MISKTYRNIIYGLLALIGIIIIVMPDVVLELAHIIFELLYELADISFEGAETLLDHIIEHLLHTDLHETQTIVFYILISIIAVPVYYLGRILTRLFIRIKNTLPAAWSLYKTRATLYWQELPLIEKIKFTAITVCFVYLASFLVM